jgi:hypothetical protein
MSVKHALIAFALLTACGTSLTPVATGEFEGPSGLAFTSAGDRDLLFVANQGRDDLRALQLCTALLGFLPDGGPDPCNPVDQQFLPAPIRVFPATIETGGRPRRLAGVRLTRPDGSNTGVMLAAGADDFLRMVDARNLLEASNNTAAIRPVLETPLPAVAVDVVAENPLDATGLEVGGPAGQPATAFAATAAPAGGQAQLLMLSIAMDESGAPQAPTVVGQCTLDPVVPMKLATIPGGDALPGGDVIYIADGAGDGVVAVKKSDIPAPSATPPACTMDRISAGGRQVRSVSVSPPWLDGATLHDAGEFLLLTLQPSQTATPGADLDPGGVLIVRTTQKDIAPIPPAGIFEAGVQPMEPLSPPSLALEATFLRPVRPEETLTTCTTAPCTPLYIGLPTNQPVALFALLAAVTGADGFTYFVDVINRRFVNTTFSKYVGAEELPLLNSTPSLQPTSNDVVNPPQFTFLSPSLPDHPNTGWMTAGVTHGSVWRVNWHTPFPGLETRSGFLSESGAGTLLLKLPAVNLAAYTADPALQLGPGDTVSFSSYLAPAGAPPDCAALAAREEPRPSRFELTIVGQPAADTLELAPASTDLAFDPSPCTTGLGVVASVRTGGDRPWLVLDGDTAKGRAKTGEPFVATERRFDYPLDYAPLPPVAPVPPPLLTDDVAVAFLLSGDEPSVVSGWLFSVAPGVTPQSFHDASLVISQGVATVVAGYSSPRHPLLVFTAVTGENSVLQADPSQPGAPDGVYTLAYK